MSFDRPNDGGSTSFNTPALNYWPGSGWQDGAVTTSGLSPLGPNTLLPYSLIQNKFVESDDLVWTHGGHSVTLGASVNRQQDNGTGPVRQSGSWTFTSLENLMLAAPTSFAGGIPGQYSATRSIRELMFGFYGNDSWKVTSRLTVNLGLRYEPATNPTEVFGNYHAVVDPPFDFEQVPHFWATNIALKNFDPRIGFAYDPFKDHKTSIRGGFGMFHDPITARLLGSCTFGTFPGTQYTQTSNFSFPTPLTNIATSPPQLIPACNYTNKWTPYMAQYNLNVQRDIGGGTILTVGYIGSRGIHLLEGQDVNAPISAGGPDGPYASIINNAIVANPRSNSAFSTVESEDGTGTSRYNSMQAGLTRRLSHNWQAQASYTWSRSLDTQSAYWGEAGGLSSGAENPNNLNWDYGPSSFNRAQVLTANSVSMLPFKRNWMVTGWQMSGIFSASSGLPINVTTGVNQAWSPNNTPQRPNYVAGCNPEVGLVTEWFNPNCFTIPAVGMIGNLGRNTLVGPDLFNMDFSLMKDTRIPKISEQFDVQFRAEFFNIFNHANFSLPTTTNFVSGSTVGTANVSSQAGVITTTADSSRQIQFGLKISF